MLSVLVNVMCSASQVDAMRPANIETSLHTPEYLQYIAAVIYTVPQSIPTYYSRPFPVVQKTAQLWSLGPRQAALR